MAASARRRRLDTPQAIRREIVRLVAEGAAGLRPSDQVRDLAQALGQAAQVLQIEQRAA
jgi:hypothetical protein